MKQAKRAQSDDCAMLFDGKHLKKRPVTVIGTLAVLVAFALLGLFSDNSVYRLHVNLLRKQTTSRRALSLSAETNSALNNLRVLLYLPTHLGDQHTDALTKIWPGLIDRSTLLQKVEVLFFIPDSKQQVLQGILDETPLFLPTQNVTTATYGTARTHQEGAMLAITEGYQRHYFDEYDWVIRLNPDTLIVNDEQIIEAITDESAGALIVDCCDAWTADNYRGDLATIHTDFTVWRPNMAPSDGLPGHTGPAEIHMRDILQPITMTGRSRTLTGNVPNEGFCRLHGKDSPVIHHHGYAEALIKCFDHMMWGDPCPEAELEYLDQNPDVKDAVGVWLDSGYQHWEIYGKKESRVFNFDLCRAAEEGSLSQKKWGDPCPEAELEYLDQNPDVKDAVGVWLDSGYQHWEIYGKKESRVFNFDLCRAAEEGSLSQNRMVDAKSIAVHCIDNIVDGEIANGGERSF